MTALRRRRSHRVDLARTTAGENHLVVEMDEWAKLTGEGIKFRGSVG